MPLRLFLAFILTVVLLGCDGSSTTPPTTLEGAWLGEGEFRVSRGSLVVKAQLELLADGSYRLLILEPAILAATGEEAGTWVRENKSLTLTPAPEPAVSEADGSADGFAALRRGSPVRVKTLTIADGLTDFRLKDGPMDITFIPN